MTLPSSYSEPLGGRLPDEAESRSANQLRQILAAQLAAGDGEVRLQILDGDEAVPVALHRSLSELFMDVLRVIGAGDAVTLVPVHQQLTTQQAADILNVSRPYLIKLLEAGEMPFETVGRHRRVRAEDVFAYRERRAAEREAGLAELARTDADLIWAVFANRFTALVDACSLVSALGRNTLLSLAEAELYRVRWSDTILDETERALAGLFAERGIDEPGAVAARQVSAMRRAFPEAMVEDYDALAPATEALPDPGDAHVIAAARGCRASVLVTENLRHFPAGPLAALGIEVKSSDEFIADAVDLDPPLALAALARMRARFERPELTPEALLLRYESGGFILTADLLRHHVGQLWSNAGTDF